MERTVGTGRRNVVAHNVLIQPYPGKSQLRNGDETSESSRRHHKTHRSPRRATARTLLAVGRPSEQLRTRTLRRSGCSPSVPVCACLPVWATQSKLDVLVVVN